MLESCAWNEVMQFSYPTGDSLPVLKKRRSDEGIILSLKAPDKSLKKADLRTLQFQGDNYRHSQVASAKQICLTVIKYQAEE